MRVALFFVFLSMFLPLVLLSSVSVEPFRGLGSFETGIIAVAFIAIIARIATRTIFRVVLGSVARVISRGFARLFLSAVAKEELEAGPRFLLNQAISFVLCWFFLGLSLFAVIYLRFGIAYEPSFLFVFVPLAVYFLVQKVISKILNVKHVLLCPLDAILVQFYFAGALSFLPLVNETRMYGKDEDKAVVGVFGVLSLLGLTLLLKLANFPELSVLCSLTVLFPLILSFPVKPMDGHYIWKWNKFVSVFLFLIAVEFVAFFGGDVLVHII